MSIEPIAAERTWYAVAPDGTEHTVVLQVGVPQPQTGGDWGSKVSLGALEPIAPVIFGVDTWQALSLSMRFIASRVQDYSEKGWVFYWERGGDPVSAGDIENFS